MPPSEEPNPFIVLTEQWLKAWQHAAALSRIHQIHLLNLVGSALELDPEARSRGFAQLSHALDGYMRTPAFLELMQNTLRTLTVPAAGCRKPD